MEGRQIGSLGVSPTGRPRERGCFVQEEHRRCQVVPVGETVILLALPLRLCLKDPLKGEGDAAEWQSRRRLAVHDADPIRPDVSRGPKEAVRAGGVFGEPHGLAIVMVIARLHLAVGETVIVLALPLRLY